MRICIIDDNTLLANALTFGLEDRGHEVTAARSGAEGLEAIKARDHDVALIDWQMPGMRGDEVAERVRALRPEIAIVLMSGGSAREDQNIATARPCQDVVNHYIEKPFTPSQLLGAIELAVGKAKGAAARHASSS